MNETWKTPLSGRVGTPEGLKTWKEAIGINELLEVNSEIYSYLEPGQSVRALGVFSISAITGAATAVPKTISVEVPPNYIIETTGNVVSIVTTNADIGNIKSQTVVNPTGVTQGTPLTQYNRKDHIIDPSQIITWRIDDIFTGQDGIIDSLILPFDATVQANQRVTFDSGVSIYKEGLNLLQILSDSTLTANYSIGSNTYTLYEIIPAV